MHLLLLVRQVGLLFLLPLLLMSPGFSGSRAVAEEADSPPRWTYAAPGELVGTPAYGRTGVVVFACEDRRLYTLDAEGRLQWRYDLRRMPLTGPSLGRDGAIYVGLSPNRVAAVSPAGRPRWTISGSSAPLAVVPVPAGPVFALFRDGEIVAVTARGGNLWRHSLPYRFSVDPVLTSNGLLVTGGESGEVAATDLVGSRAWSQRVAARVTALAATGDGGVRIGDAAGTVTAVDARGRVAWSHRVLHEPVRSVVMDATGAAVVHSTAGSLTRIGGNGDLSWSATPREWGVAAVAARADGIVFGVTGDGTIIVLDAAGARVAETRGPRRAPYDQVILTPGGRLLLGARDWVIELHDVLVQSSPAAAGAGNAWSNLRGGAAADGVSPAYRAAGTAVYRDRLDYIYLDELVGSERATDRRRALTDIEQRLAAGRLSSDFIYTVELLFRLATQPRVTPSGVHEAAPEEDRVRALEALARLADGTAQRRLAGLLAEERSAVVRIALMRAMGNIGLDPDGDAVSAVRSVVRRPDATGAEQMAAVEALYSLGETNWHPVRYRAGEALAWVAAERRIPAEIRSVAGQRLLRLR